MNIRISRVETELLGKPVIDLFDIVDKESIGKHTSIALTSHQPILITCKLPANRVDLISAAEEIGYRVVECQIHLRRLLYGKTTPVDTSRFTYSCIECTDDLEEVLEFAPAAFQTVRPGRPGRQAHSHSAY